MTDGIASISGLLLALQHGDSQFPSGGFAFSGGLETLFADGRVSTPDSVSEFVIGQLKHRWGPGDRVALAHAYRGAPDFDRLIAIDREYHVLCLAQSLRQGSCRNGRAFLGTHARLGTANTVEYQRLIAQGQAHGHLPVMQGFVWKQAGLSGAEAAAAAAHVFCMGFLSAAVRLGRLGHIQAQRIRSDIAGVMTAILSRRVPDDEPMTGFSPAADIAAMRHDEAHVRLFAS